MRKPVGHPLHSIQLIWPAEGWKKPPAHSEQADTAEATENFPTAHSVQVLAAGSAPLLVTEPAGHTTQEASLESVEYLPAAHAVQVIPPTDMPLSAIEPAWHGKQNVWPSDSW
jgi:hypothetical protein